MQSFSVPFPVRVIAHLLGLPAGLEADIKRWSDDSVVSLGAFVDDARRIEAMRGMAELQRMWVEEIGRRRAEAGDDLVTELLGVELDDPDAGPRPLDLPELLSIVQQLMIAGNETTTKLLNETLRLLAEHPARLVLWEGEPLPETRARLESLGLRSIVYDPCGNIPASGDWLSVMQGNAERLESALR